MPGPETADLALLTDAARAAGEIAMRYVGRSPRVWDKGTEGPVTEADLAVNAYLEEVLRAARPDYGWLSEESADAADRPDQGAIFVIDPIDGTRAFIEGSRDWAHSLAVVRDGAVVAGVVFLPRRDALYAAALGQGARLNDRPVQVSNRAGLRNARVLGSKANFGPGHWRDGTPPPIKRHFRSSLAYRMAAVAEGQFEAMLTLRPTWEWDVAAGTLIVTEAGGRVSDQSGLALRFNNPHPQVGGVVAGGAIQPELLSRICR